MKVFFVGAGPGDPELVTVKGKRLIEQADIIIYAGSLVNPDLLPPPPDRDSARETQKKAENKDAGYNDREETRPRIYDSASMDLEEVSAVYRLNKARKGTIVRLHTGDPAVYGAIQEQIDFCRKEGITFEVVPGVSSFSAAAASLEQELTLPGVSQSVILSRISGRTKTPPAEDIGLLSVHRASMVLFLSAGKLAETVEKLKEGYPPDTPAAVVYRASWPDEKIIRGTVDTIAERTEEAGITRQALIVVGEVLTATIPPGEEKTTEEKSTENRENDISSPGSARRYEKSKLYDPGFTHGYRNARDNERENEQ